ncbi:MAG: hypothetical protein A3K18_35150 [Lentisphaerae bacterium RIFOXYA12_64_32]|nr:MAG: hypothetical protein A3K18_35150 [Lentisphaerae bacterium RIFOXYA12_64_32]
MTVSQPGFSTDGWHAADVPTTVLNALVHAGVYPDPRYGLNNYQIPDASDEFNQKHDLAKFSHLPDKRNPWRDPWWYRLEFDAPADCGTRQRLVFQAINYRADVWLNGSLLGGRQRVVGAFRRFALDATGILRTGRRNALAVRVWPPEHCGVPQAQLVPFQTPRAHLTGVDNDIMKDVCINLAAVGYDCAPTVRDRLMGLWQEVRLDWSGPVRIVDPFVRTKLPLPELAPAALTVSTELVNEFLVPVRGILRVTVMPQSESDALSEPRVSASGPSEAAPSQSRLGPSHATAEYVTVEKAVNLTSGESTHVEMTPAEYPALNLANPRLWWPAGHGAQELYQLQTEFLIDGACSDRRTVTFGIREVTKVLHTADGSHGLRLHVNGRRIFCRGGYLQADTLLDWAMLAPERWTAEFQYLARANLNTVSFEDLPNLPDSIMDLADRMGIMIWNCFFQCHWLNRDDHPLDHDLLEASAQDIARRCRNHPSVVVYMCMNEGATRESQYRRWRRQVQALDGTRVLIPSGYGDYDAAARCYQWPHWIQPDTPVGANDCTPKSYGWQDPTWFYRMVRDDRTWMFKIESGSASVPAPESLRRFIPDLTSDLASLEFPLNRQWANHGANSYYKPFHEALCRRHGLPVSLDDYWWKANLVSFEEHRAMFEAVNHRLWELTSGFLEWKLNGCWPTIQWQIYDYFLRPTASYYAIRKACAPIVVQLSPVDNTVSVVITSRCELRRARLTVQVFDAGMKRRWKKTVHCTAAADACTDVCALPQLPAMAGVFFVRLDLADAAGTALADNFYWRSDQRAEHDRNCYEPLNRIPRAKLEGTWRQVSDDADRPPKTEVILRNPSRAIAVLTRVRVLDATAGEELLPVFWTDNYVSLLPGESKEMVAELPTAPSAERLQVAVDGWNVTATTLDRQD